MRVFAKEELSKIKQILTTFILIILITFPLKSSSEVNRDFPKLKKPLELSLLFPGLGQIKEKKFFKGALFITGELYTIYKIIENNGEGNSSYIKYKNALSKDDAVKYRKEVEKFDKRRNKYIVAGIGIWVINLIDIYFHVKRKSQLKIRIKNEENKTFTLGFSYCF